VPVEALYAAVVDPHRREEWLPGVQLRERTATPHRSARYDWGEGSTRVVVGFDSKADGKSLVALLHERLPDGECDHEGVLARAAVDAQEPPGVALASLSRA
jgi:hypothetical protein